MDHATTLEQSKLNRSCKQAAQEGRANEKNPRGRPSRKHSLYFVGKMAKLNLPPKAMNNLRKDSARMAKTWSPRTPRWPNIDQRRPISMKVATRMASRAAQDGPKRAPDSHKKPQDALQKNPKSNEKPKENQCFRVSNAS